MEQIIYRKDLHINVTLIVLAFTTALTQSSCMYLHNEVRAKQAETALTQYHQYQTDSGGVFGVMLENHAKAEQALSEGQAAAAEIKFKIYTSSVPPMRWSQILKEVDKLIIKNIAMTGELKQQFATTVKKQLDIKELKFPNFSGA